MEQNVRAVYQWMSSSNGSSLVRQAANFSGTDEQNRVALQENAAQDVKGTEVLFTRVAANPIVSMESESYWCRLAGAALPGFGWNRGR